MHESEILSALKSRRSCRAFKRKAVPKATLKTIAEAGLWAANGKGRQCTKIVVVTDRKLRNRIAELNRKIGCWVEGFDPFYGAPVMMIVLGEAAWPTRVYDGSLVMGNLMLAAHALGVDSIWIHRAREEFESPEGKAILQELGIEGDWEGIGHCALGYAAKPLPLPPPRKPDRLVWAGK